MKSAHLFKVKTIVLCVMAALWPCMARGETSSMESWFLRQARDSAVSFDSRVAYYDSLIAKYPQPIYVIEKGELCYDAARFADASKAFESLYAGRARLPIAMRLRLILDRGVSFKQTGKLPEALRCFKEVVEVTKPDTLGYMDTQAYIEITDLFLRLGHKEKFLKYAALAEESSKKHGQGGKKNGNLDLSLDLIRGSVSMSLGDYRGAFESYEKVASGNAPSSQKAIALNSLGVIFSLQRKHEIAEKYYQRSLEESDFVNRPVTWVNYLVSLADQGDYTRLIDKALSSSGYLPRLRGKMEEYKYWRILAEAYDKTGRVKDAYRALTRGMSLRDSVLYVMNTEKTADILVELEAIEANRDGKMSIRESRMRNVALVCGTACVLMVCALCLLWWKWRKRMARERAVADERLALEGRRHAEESEAMRERIAGSDDKLTETAVQIAKFGDMMARIEDVIGKTSLSKLDMVCKIRMILSQIKVEDDSWKIFSALLDHLNRGFFDKLQILCPSLTGGEMRECVLSMMNLSVKEIAEMTHRSVRTVESIRYSLRRKLGITEDTGAFMRMVSSTPLSGIDSLRRPGVSAESETE